jgi:NAD(P)-dependent dehydrogenase (short-subunit alcohol dehydrogenase family)
MLMCLTAHTTRTRRRGHRNEKEVAELVRQSQEKLGALDVLILNHGIFPASDIPSTLSPRHSLFSPLHSHLH